MEEMNAFAVQHVEEKIDDFVETLDFKKALMGGLDRESVYAGLKKLEEQFQPAIDNQLNAVKAANEALEAQKTAEEKMTEMQAERDNALEELAAANAQLDPKKRMVESAVERAIEAEKKADERIAAAEEKANERAERAEREATQRGETAEASAKQRAELAEQKAEAQIDEAKKLADQAVKAAQDKAAALVEEANQKQLAAEERAEQAEKYSTEVDVRNEALHTEIEEVKHRIADVTTANDRLSDRNAELEEREKSRAAEHEMTMTELVELRTRLTEERQIIANERADIGALKATLAKREQETSSLQKELEQRVNKARDDAERMVADAEHRTQVEREAAIQRARSQAWDIVDKAEREAHTARAGIAQYWLDLQDEVKLLEDRRAELMGYMRNLGNQLLDMAPLAIMPEQPPVLPDEENLKMPEGWMPGDDPRGLEAALNGTDLNVKE